jgi:hypothetical protein
VDGGKRMAYKETQSNRDDTPPVTALRAAWIE